MDVIDQAKLVSVEVKEGAIVSAQFETPDGPVTMLPKPPFKEGEGLFE